jgi:hypothetical protein
MTNRIFPGIDKASLYEQGVQDNNSVFLDQNSRRVFQMSHISYPGKRRNYNMVENIKDDRPTILRDEQVQTHYERLARGRWGQGIGSYNQFFMHPVESHNLVDIPMEKRFADGVLRATSSAVDRLNLPLVRRPVQLAPRGSVMDYGGQNVNEGGDLADEVNQLNATGPYFMN